MYKMFETVFSPIGQEYCVIYYFLMVLTFVQFVLVALSMAYVALTEKSFKGKDYLHTLGLVSTMAVTYMMSRIQYSICVKAL
jgi:hypothetical protein